MLSLAELCCSSSCLIKDLATTSLPEYVAIHSHPTDYLTPLRTRHNNTKTNMKVRSWKWRLSDWCSAIWAKKGWFPGFHCWINSHAAVKRVWDTETGPRNHPRLSLIFTFTFMVTGCQNSLLIFDWCEAYTVTPVWNATLCSTQHRYTGVSRLIRKSNTKWKTFT